MAGSATYEHEPLVRELALTANAAFGIVSVLTAGGIHVLGILARAESCPAAPPDSHGLPDLRHASVRSCSAPGTRGVLAREDGRACSTAGADRRPRDDNPLLSGSDFRHRPCRGRSLRGFGPERRRRTQPPVPSRSTAGRGVQAAFRLMLGTFTADHRQGRREYPRLGHSRGYPGRGSALAELPPRLHRCRDVRRHAPDGRPGRSRHGRGDPRNGKRPIGSVGRNGRKTTITQGRTGSGSPTSPTSRPGKALSRRPS